MSEDVQAALREMAGQIGSLTATVKTLTDNWRTQDEKASTGRAVMHEKIDALRGEIHEYKGKLEKVIEKVAGMEPTIAKINMAEQRAIGVFWVSRMFYAVGIAMTAGVTYVLANWVKISIK